MKVLHISTFDTGGAGLAAIRIHNSLIECGVESKVLVKEKSSDNPLVYQIAHPIEKTHSGVINLLLRIFKHFGIFLTKRDKYLWMTNKARRGIERLCYTSPVTCFDVLENELVRQADIIHLHWVADFLDYQSFFEKVNKPIVWTLHDENIGLGGFHYRIDKEKYYSKLSKVEREYQRIKSSMLSSMHLSLVALSKEMKSFLLSVDYLKESQISIIHNSVDTNAFNLLPKNESRSVLGIDSYAKVVLFCCVDLSDDRKGLRELVKALEILNDSRILLLCMGGGNLPIDTKIKVIRVGPVYSSSLMSLVYSCADVFAMPSYQEAFAQTPLEAMACGVPVVTFPCSGTEELINEFNGIRCDTFSVEQLASSIACVLNGNFSSHLIRSYVETCFSPRRIAEQYCKVYDNLVKSN